MFLKIEQVKVNYFQSNCVITQRIYTFQQILLLKREICCSDLQP